MKMLICGKGGSGKSTISSLIAKEMSKLGYKILLVDTDESNMGLHRLMGVQLPVNLLDSFGGKKEFKKKLNRQFPIAGPDDLFAGMKKINDLPLACVSQTGSIKLLVIGKIHHFGEGCACPMGVLSRKFISNLKMEKDEILIIDTEAGVEHFGRGLESNCDLIIGVVDPVYDSFFLAKKMQEMAKKSGKEIYFVLNKINDDVEDIMVKQLDVEKIIGKILYNNTIFKQSLAGSELKEIPQEIKNICQFIKNEKMKK